MNKKNFGSVAKTAVLSVLLILVLGLGGVLAACKKSATVTLDITEKTMYVADSFKLTATTDDENADITWSTGNEGVATVKRGTVTAVAAGEAVITATLDNGASASCTVTVLDRTVTISEAEKTVDYDLLGEDKAITLTATSTDGGAVEWESSNPDIAVVSGGVVAFMPPKAKTARVTVTARRGAASASCVITVTSPSIPDDYYVLAKETNANVVANPGTWFYHADGNEGSDYGFKRAPAYGNGGLTAELDKFPSVADKKYFRFRYQPDLPEGTEYTVKLKLTVNVDGEAEAGTHSNYGGTSVFKVKAGSVREIVYCGTVNSSEPFHINLRKAEVAAAGSVSFAITDIVVKRYEKGDEENGNDSLYDLVRGDTATTCKNAGKWYYMINPVNAGSADFTEASYDNGVVTLAMAAALTGTDHQLRIRPDFAAGTRVIAVFTVSLSAPGEVAYGLNNASVREKLVFGEGGQAVGSEQRITAEFTVSDTVPFVIWISPAEGAGALTMTVSEISFGEKPPETYNVSFDSKGGSPVEAAAVTEGGAISEPAAPVYEGHKFVGWYLAEDCSGAAVAFPYTPEGSVTLYAKWLKLYTVAFNSNGGSAVEAITDIPEGASVTLPSPVLEGYNFLGWYESEDAEVRVSTSYAPTSDITLIAKWAEVTVPTYTVTYNTMGGEAVEAETVLEGEGIALPAAPVYAGHIFDGWYLSEDYSGDRLSGTFTPEGDTTLYAKWLKLYTVTFNSNGGSAVEQEEVTEGEALAEPEGPVLEGFVFGGWYDNEELNGEALSFPYTPQSSVTLYARWLSIYTVSYSLGYNGAPLKAADRVVEGSALSTDNPSRKGFDFAGWYDNAELSGEALADGYIPSADITLYASWSAQTEYKLEKGDYGTVNKNRDAWYYNLQGTQASATITSASYSNGAIDFAVTGAKQQSSVGSNAIQLRYLPDFAGNTKYIVTLKVTVSMDGLIKLAPDNKGQSQSIRAGVETVLTFGGEVEWNDSDKLYRPLLIQFYPAENGDAAIRVTDISLGAAGKDLYAMEYGLNGAVCGDPGTWYWFAGTKAHVSSAVYSGGAMSLTCINMDASAYCLRYQPEAFSEAGARAYSVSFKVKLSGGLDVRNYITVDGGAAQMTFSEADEEGFVAVTAPYTLKDGTAYYIQFQDKSGSTSSVTMTVKDVVFTAAQ